MTTYSEKVRGVLLVSGEEPKIYFYAVFIDIPNSWQINPTFVKTPPKFDPTGTIPTLTFIADSDSFGDEPNNDIKKEFSTIMLPGFKTSGSYNKITVIVQGTNGKKKTGTVTNSAPVDIPFLSSSGGSGS